MHLFTAVSVPGGLAFPPSFSISDDARRNALVANPQASSNFPCTLSLDGSNKRSAFWSPSRASVSSESSSSSSSRTVNGVDQSVVTDEARQRTAPRSAHWTAAREYLEQGFIHEGRIEGCNAGGLLIKFYSLTGFLPYPLLSPSHECKEPHKTIQEIAQGLQGSDISVQVIEADEENMRLIFSEKKASWSKFSPQLNVGDILDARVAAVESFGAFVHLRFPDGLYHLMGLVHASEVSWYLVQDVRDILRVDDEVRVTITSIDRVKERINLSIKRLEEDPLLETLDKVIPQDVSEDPDADNHFTIEPLPGLDTIIEELLKEDGIDSVKITRQGFEKRVVSQDLQLWLSNAPPIGDRYTLLARAGRQVQEIRLSTSLDQDGIKMALQRVLERIP